MSRPESKGARPDRPRVLVPVLLICLAIILLGGVAFLSISDYGTRRAIGSSTPHPFPSPPETFPSAIGYQGLRVEVVPTYSELLRPGDGTLVDVNFNLRRSPGALEPQASWFFDSAATGICKLRSPDAEAFPENQLYYRVGSEEMTLHCSWSVVPLHEGLHLLVFKAVFLSKYVSVPIKQRPPLTLAYPQQFPIVKAATLTVREPIFTLDHAVAILGAGAAFIAGLASIAVAWIRIGVEKPPK